MNDPIPHQKKPDAKLLRIRKRLERIFAELDLIHDVTVVCRETTAFQNADNDYAVAHVLQRCATNTLYSQLRALTHVIEQLGGQTEYTDEPEEHQENAGAEEHAGHRGSSEQPPNIEAIFYSYTDASALVSVAHAALNDGDGQRIGAAVTVLRDAVQKLDSIRDAFDIACIRYAKFLKQLGFEPPDGNDGEPARDNQVREDEPSDVETPHEEE